MITSTAFKIRFPEFTSIADAKINLLIDEAYLSIGAKYGKFQDTAVLYFVAHNLVIETNGLNAMSATVSSQSVDGVSVSYAMPTTINEINAYYGSTGYGQKYLYYFNIVRVGQASIVWKRMITLDL